MEPNAQLIKYHEDERSRWITISSKLSPHTHTKKKKKKSHLYSACLQNNKRLKINNDLIYWMLKSIVFVNFQILEKHELINQLVITSNWQKSGIHC